MRCECKLYHTVHNPTGALGTIEHRCSTHDYTGIGTCNTGRCIAGQIEDLTIRIETLEHRDAENSDNSGR